MLASKHPIFSLDEIRKIETIHSFIITNLRNSCAARIFLSHNCIDLKTTRSNGDDKRIATRLAILRIHKPRMLCHYFDNSILNFLTNIDVYRLLVFFAPAENIVIFCF